MKTLSLNGRRQAYRADKMNQELEAPKKPQYPVVDLILFQLFRIKTKKLLEFKVEYKEYLEEYKKYSAKLDEVLLESRLEKYRWQIFNVFEEHFATLSEWQRDELNKHLAYSDYETTARLICKNERIITDEIIDNYFYDLVIVYCK
jgi:hypothetical protein